MKKLMVVGAGAMGRQIALQCALQGMDVSLTDSAGAALEAAAAFAQEYLDGRVAKGRITSEFRSAALNRLELTPRLDQAVVGASLVIEAIVEQFEPKRALFEELDRLCAPATILATNSSNMRGSRLAAVTRRP